MTTVPMVVVTTLALHLPLEQDVIVSVIVVATVVHWELEARDEDGFLESVLEEKLSNSKG